MQTASLRQGAGLCKLVKDSFNAVFSFIVLMLHVLTLDQTKQWKNSKMSGHIYDSLIATYDEAVEAPCLLPGFHAAVRQEHGQ